MHANRVNIGEASHLIKDTHITGGSKRQGTQMWQLFCVC